MEGVTERVKGKVVGMAVLDTVADGDRDLVIVTERVRVTVTDLVNGWVVAMPDIECVTVADLVNGWVVAMPDIERVIVTDLVNGWVVGIPVIERVRVGDIV